MGTGFLFRVIKCKIMVIAAQLINILKTTELYTYMGEFDSM